MSKFCWIEQGKLKIEFKHFEKFESPNKSNLVKVFPIPIHEDISFEFIYKLKKHLNMK